MWEVSSAPDLSRLNDEGDVEGMVLRGYEPRVVSSDDWRVVSSFVVGNLSRVHGIGWDGMKQAVRALTRLSVWCVSEGIALDAERVLHPDTVDRFVVVHSRVLSKQTLSKLRDDLRRLGPALTTRAPWLPGEKSIGRTLLSAPYTSREVALIDRDVSGQRTGRLIIAARAIRTLGLGCGIAGRGNAMIHGTDITRQTDGAAVVMTPSGRKVICLERYADDLVELAELAGSGRIVGSSITTTDKNLSSNLARSVHIDSGRIKLRSARLRAT